MDIPGDTGKIWRLSKFIDYHALGDADMNFPLLIRYADSHSLSVNNRFWLAFLYSTCYSVPTTCFLFESITLHTKRSKIEDFWLKNKYKMVFQSDKKYVKNMDWFITLVEDFKLETGKKPYMYFKAFRAQSPQQTYDLLYKTIMKWRFFGRFTTFLLIEAIHKLTPLKADSDWFDWKNGNTATSGMMHIMYLDEEAIKFDKTNIIASDTMSRLVNGLVKLKERIRMAHPTASINITDIETALCGFRKLFKQSRYGGYYIDRAQTEIVFMEELHPDYNNIWGELWYFRQLSFPHIFLGELNGHIGIQKHRYKDWTEKGLTGVEAIS